MRELLDQFHKIWWKMERGTRKRLDFDGNLDHVTLGYDYSQVDAACYCATQHTGGPSYTRRCHYVLPGFI